MFFFTFYKNFLDLITPKGSFFHKEETNALKEDFICEVLSENCVEKNQFLQHKNSESFENY